MRVLTLPLQAHHAMEKMEEFVYRSVRGRERAHPPGAESMHLYQHAEHALMTSCVIKSLSFLKW